MMTERLIEHQPAAIKPYSALRIVGRVFANLLTIFIGAYGLHMTISIVLRWLISESSTYVGIINTFLPVKLLLAVILFPLALILRRRIPIMLLIAPVLVFAFTYGTLFLPRGSIAAPPDATQFSLLTYNLYSLAEGLDGIATVIRDANADVVALQELSQSAANYFTTEFAAEYPYQALHSNTIPSAGQGILSRYPLENDVYWQSNFISIGLGHQRADVLLNGASVALYNLHPVHPGMVGGGVLFDDDPRRLEIEDLVGRALNESGAVMLVGDFNLSDTTDDYKRITAHFRDLHRAVGHGMGFTYPDWNQPNSLPRKVAAQSLVIPRVMRLDYVFYDEQYLVGLSAQVWPVSGGSDHHPLLAHLALLNDA